MFEREGLRVVGGGMVAIEDVLEQIVGDIEDEHDVEEDSYIKPLPSGDFLIKALTPIENLTSSSIPNSPTTSSTPSSAW